MRASTPTPDPNAALGFAFFNTALGPCAVSWNNEAVTGVALPGQAEVGIRSRMRGRQTEPRAAPAHAREAIEGITALLEGDAVDLRSIPLDLGGVAPFDRRVIEVARQIAVGETATYGELARRVGEPREARGVGQVMARNRFPIIVPCHRVVGAGKALGGFSGPGGAETKLRLLAIERCHSREPALF